jgi:hypothetical protein
VEVPTAEVIASLDLPPSVQPAGPDTPLPVAAPGFSVSGQPTHSDEHQIIHLKMFRRYPFRCLGYLLLVLAPVGAGVWLLLTERPLLGALSLIVGGLVLCRLVVWWLRMRRTRVTLTNESCVLQCGIFSRQAMAIELPNVRDIQVKQSLLGRLLNVGDLVLSYDKGEMQQVTLMAVPAPKNLADRIHQRRLSSADGLAAGAVAAQQV